LRSYPETFDDEDRHMVADIVLICERILEHSAPEPQSVYLTDTNDAPQSGSAKAH
jgi:hypothetical protein